MTRLDRVRNWRGPALFAYGFRPFFLFGALYAMLAIAIWTLWLDGVGALPTSFPPLAWHAHELLFGYAIAVIAGFLLTAVPNWTGRLPVVGWPLVGLSCLWLAGRVAMALADAFHPIALAFLTIAFPMVLLGLTAREVYAGRNTRNIKVVAVLAVLCLAQIGMHVEVWRTGASIFSARLALSAYLMLVMIVGGRIIPSFTTNWIKRQNPGRTPATFDGFDKTAMIFAGAALACWTALPAVGAASPVVGVLLGLSAVLHAVRVARWAPDRVWAEKLVAVLHIAYAFMPLGFAVAAVSALMQDATSDIAAIHLWAIGAIGLMTLAVMTRATRGHTGRALAAPSSTTALYALLAFAAMARFVAAFLQHNAVALTIAGAAWTLAFAGFAALYGPMCLTRRPSD